MDEIEVLNGDGEPVLLQRPQVHQELCTGCGICEFQCPMGGESAIRVYAPTDTAGQSAA